MNQFEVGQTLIMNHPIAGMHVVMVDFVEEHEALTEYGVHLVDDRTAPGLTAYEDELLEVDSGRVSVSADLILEAL